MESLDSLFELFQRETEEDRKTEACIKIHSLCDGSYIETGDKFIECIIPVISSLTSNKKQFHYLLYSLRRLARDGSYRKLYSVISLS